MNDPELVVLDEPMSGLDPIGRKEVRDLILELRDQGKTVFFSSHILTDVEAIADRIAIIARGQLQAQGTPSELVKRTAIGVDVTVRAAATADDSLAAIATGTSHVRRAGDVADADAPRRCRCRRVARPRARARGEGRLGRAAPRDARRSVPARDRERRCVVGRHRGPAMTASFGRIWAIALNTFREAARLRVVYGFVVVVVAANLFAIVLGRLSVHEDTADRAGCRARRDLARRLVDRDLPRPVPALHRGPAPHDPRDRQQADRALGVRRRQVHRDGARADAARRAVRARDGAAVAPAGCRRVDARSSKRSCSRGSKCSSSPRSRSSSRRSRRRSCPAIFALAIWALGRVTPDIEAAARDGAPALKVTARIALELVPDLHLFSPSGPDRRRRRHVVHADFVSWGYVATASLHGLGWIVALLAVACLVFQRRDFV